MAHDIAATAASKLAGSAPTGNPGTTGENVSPLGVGTNTDIGINIGVELGEEVGAHCCPWLYIMLVLNENKNETAQQAVVLLVFW